MTVGDLGVNGWSGGAGRNNEGVNGWSGEAGRNNEGVNR